MGQRFYKIIVACLAALLCGNAYGQVQTKSTLVLQRVSSPVSIQRTIAFPSEGFTSKNDVIRWQQSSIKKIHNAGIPVNYYVQQFGFVCKKELQLQKAIRVPFFFRLGSLTYCNYLEAK